MFKALLVVVTMLIIGCDNANAAESWVADGVRQVSASNSSIVTVLPFNASGFATQGLCLDYIADQNTLDLSKNTKGYAMTNKANGKCSKVTEAQ